MVWGRGKYWGENEFYFYNLVNYRVDRGERVREREE